MLEFPAHDRLVMYLRSAEDKGGALLTSLNAMGTLPKGIELKAVTLQLRWTARARSLALRSRSTEGPLACTCFPALKPDQVLEVIVRFNKRPRSAVAWNLESGWSRDPEVK
ncbi:MAG: hypothetical protein R3F17_08480 [Planctomycetota bacterium]